MPCLAGCVREEGGGKTTLYFVTWKPAHLEAWEEAYRLFEAENPDIKLAREVGPHSFTAFHELLTQKLKNRSRDVDVFFMDVIWPPEFAAAGRAGDEISLPVDTRGLHFFQRGIRVNP